MTNFGVFFFFYERTSLLFYLDIILVENFKHACKLFFQELLYIRHYGEDWWERAFCPWRHNFKGCQSFRPWRHDSKGCQSFRPWSYCVWNIHFTLSFARYLSLFTRFFSSSGLLTLLQKTACYLELKQTQLLKLSSKRNEKVNDKTV